VDQSLYDSFYELEGKHWWFVARKKIIIRLIECYLSRKEDNEILDIGCGTGLTMMGLKRFGAVVGLDSSPKAVGYARSRGAQVYQGTLPNDLPPAWQEKFDLITLLDVLEHIEDDVQALASIHRMLKKGGLLICTVPAYPFLWSGHDRINGHKRRYMRSELTTKVEQAGFLIKKISYYNTFLAPLIAGSRLMRKIHPKHDLPKSDVYIMPRPLNMLLKWLFESESYVLPYVDFPFEISLICISARSDNP